MSNPLKSIGKIFKKVVKAAKVVLPIALAVGAVVFTGGAALGVLPSFGAAIGGVVSSLGLSTALTGALTGAVTSAGFGAALGFVTGGKKGMQKGALMGALTGGVLGAASPSTFGIVKGADGATTTMNALKHGGNAFGAGKATTSVVKGADGTFSMGGKIGAPAAAPAPTTAPAPAAPLGTKAELQALGNPNPAPAAQSYASVGNGSQGMAPAASTSSAAAAPVASAPALTGGTAAAPASGGMMGFLNQNPMLAGQLLQGVGGALSGGGEEGYAERYKAEEEAERRRSEFLYGGIDKNNPFGMPSTIGGGALQPRYFYDREQNRVVDRAQGGY